MTDTAPIDTRALVQRVSRHSHAFLYTAPVLDAAAELLADWCAVAERHGVDLSTYQGNEWAESLAHRAVEMAGHVGAAASSTGWTSASTTRAGGS